MLDTIDQWTRKRDVSEAVLHSDQGFQYTSQVYNKRLEAFSVKGSHFRKATCLESATCIESFFSHLVSQNPKFIKQLRNTSTFTITSGFKQNSNSAARLSIGTLLAAWFFSFVYLTGV
nr:hypothetical protein [Paenibacillus agricola]